MRNMPFCSRDEFYKSVFGAVKENEPFVIKVLLPRDGYVKGVVAVFDRDGTDEKRFELFDDGNCLENGFYTRSANITLSEGLYFYKFIMYTNEGERTLLDKGGGIGEFEPPNGKKWQLTVYSGEFTTPEHIRGGIIYQIFPDRFYKGENDEKIPDDRFIRSDWGGIPEHNQQSGKRTLGNDYFCGNFDGIRQKLSYLAGLGVNIIYLNPIFEAHSNHRYNTADYFKTDAALGSDKDFENLCKDAKKYGIDIILDGVFSHTGDDSKYFNAKNRYDEIGAANSINSPYFSWYKFKNFPNEYDCWWGVPSLPEVNENDKSFTEFITGKDGVIRYWLKKGASGFRLDVADELPDEFLDNVRKAVKAENSENYLLGEVWEDATNKISYSNRRRFLRGKQLDSVMNYPFRNAIFRFIKGGDATDFAESIMQIVENYPLPALHTLMNHIGTHDTPRAITELCGESADGKNRDWQAQKSLSSEDYERGVNMLKSAVVLQYTLPGIPSVYYGDEAGLCGYGDPFCRGCFPWGNENKDLLEFYKKIGLARRNCKAFENGKIEFLSVGLGYAVFERTDGKSSAVIAVNRWCNAEKIPTDKNFSGYKAIFGDLPENGFLNIPANGFLLLCK